MAAYFSDHFTRGLLAGFPPAGGTTAGDQLSPATLAATASRRAPAGASPESSEPSVDRVVSWPQLGDYWREERARFVGRMESQCE